MDVDIDSNNGGDDLIYQIAGDRFFMVVFVNKAALAETRERAQILSKGFSVPGSESGQGRG
jgi:hypothetical protein